MIKNLEIKNFKSIKHLKLDCKRVNLFIGKPNTGKSNILEGVGMFSLTQGVPIVLIRFENISNLFYDQDISEKVEITSDNLYFEMIFQNGKFIAREYIRNISQGHERRILNYGFECDYSGNATSFTNPSRPTRFKFYKFAKVDRFSRLESDFLRPPRGENLLQILLTNKALRKVIVDMFSEYGFRILFKPQEGRIEVQKEIEDVIISHPYSLVSDTLQRVVFHLAAIETNKDSVIIFEEPEAHAFPYYTKFLAERIALDKTNQYFISTHNPYFLLSVLEKTPKDDIRIFITYFKDYQTKVRPITKKEMPEILDLDASVFFNLNQFLEEE